MVSIITKLHRFRPVYSLRMLFLALTIFGVWLGWQVNLVQSRQALLKEIEAERERTGKYGLLGTHCGYNPKVSFIRSCLGDEPHVSLFLPWPENDVRSAKVQWLFPESNLSFLNETN